MHTKIYEVINLKLKYHKITPVSGFDKYSVNNAHQNNYAYSIAEMGDYIYIGTGRNIPYNLLKYEAIEWLRPPLEVSPQFENSRAEIWRYKKDNSENWKMVYKADEDAIIGFKSMIKYTTPNYEAIPYETAIYVCALSYDSKIRILKSTDGMNWNKIETDIPYSHSGSLEIHLSKLYMSVIDYKNIGRHAVIYSTTDPERKGWTLVSGSFENNPYKNPKGDAYILKSFNNHLYAGCAADTGFEVWRSEGICPKIDSWRLIVDKGAGDAFNEIPLSFGIFKDRLYVGTGIRAGILSFDTKKKFVVPKGFDLIRIDKNDNWEVVIGGKPKQEAEPSYGKRNAASQPSGMGNFANAYCWQIQEYYGELFISTWDWTDMILPLYNEIQKYEEHLPLELNSTPINFIANYPKILYKLLNLIQATFGFDLYSSKDGAVFKQVSINGLNNPYNYGAPILFKASDGLLYLGSANPFEGCEVYTLRKDFDIN